MAEKKGGQTGVAAPPKKKMPPAMPIADPMDYVIRVGDGWTLSDGTYNRVRDSRKKNRDVPQPTFVHLAFRAMNALSSLQLSRDAPITMATIDVTTSEMWNQLPPPVKDIVVVPSPSGPELWGPDDKMHAEMYNRMHTTPAARDKQGVYSFYGQVKGKPWVIWPIWVEDQWGKDFLVVAWHSYAAPESPGVYDRIGSYVIYDPRRNPQADADGKHGQIKERLDRINMRICQFFEQAKIDWRGANVYYGLCSPMGLDETSSGERCYATVKELLDTIVTTTFIKKEEVPPKHYWPALSRWVFPYSLRMEMTGMVAWLVMACHSFNARIAIECLEPKLGWEVVVDGKRRMLKPGDLTGPRRGPALTDEDYRLDPNAATRLQHEPVQEK
ncbi:hypothetical protein F4818DRAFT_433661 [Hypoxylon cercidicola]|nr:hypothetical protein F4818DRAFT_433661 [Hypoxylon cercidicola]